MAKGIRLTEDDYIRLYPLWKPIEIQNEFHPHSHCESQIRNYNRRLKYSTQAFAFKTLLKAYMNDRPDDVSLANWKLMIESEIEEAKEQARVFVWGGVEARKKLRSTR